MGDLSNSVKQQIALAANQKDAWAQAVNEKTPYSYNTAKIPDWIWGKYTQFRPYGATHLNPEGIDAGFAKAHQNSVLGGILGEMVKEEDN